MNRAKTIHNRARHRDRDTTGKIMKEYPDPIELLQNDHVKGKEVLVTLEESVNSIERNGFTAESFQKIAASAEYIGSQLRIHYEKEDRCLYPLLQKRAVDSHTAVHHERREMWQTFKELMMLLRDIEDGKVHATTIRELVTSVRAVVGYFRNHIEREEEIVFPMVRRLLTPDEYAYLGREIAEFAEE